MDKCYIVLVGDVGTGKSTLTEKTCDANDISSDSKTSVTKTTRTYHSVDGNMIIADTPGCNAMRDRLSHNAEIAVAMNFADVSKIMIVVKADTRIDNVIGNVNG